MQDWINLLTAIIQLVTAIMMYRLVKKDNKKGTKKRRAPRKRK